jgi:hypothetical protein
LVCHKNNGIKLLNHLDERSDYRKTQSSPSLDEEACVFTNHVQLKIESDQLYSEASHQNSDQADQSDVSSELQNISYQKNKTIWRSDEITMGAQQGFSNTVDLLLILQKDILRRSGKCKHSSSL